VEAADAREPPGHAGRATPNHPDTLAARGVPAEFIARANEKVARINAAWDRIKRERGL
jgi:hypothetical protein